MFVKDLIIAINSLADDQIPENEVWQFINDAISAINIEVNANYPMVSEYGYDYEEIDMPEHWQRMLIIPYGKARVKEKDSSQFEWEIAYEQFFENLLLFKNKYDIPEKYKNTEARSKFSEDSIVMNRPFIWGGW